MASNVVSIRLSDKDLAEVDRIAKETGRKRAFVVQWLMLRALREEDEHFKYFRKIREQSDGK